MQSIRPFLMFEGKAEEAMTLYVSVFGGKINDVTRYAAGQAGAEGSVMRASFTIGQQTVLCIDSPGKHDFTFTPSFSMFVDCDSQEEQSAFYEKLLEGGTALMPLGEYGFSRRFGWLKDRFGISWQINLP
jgi:predicted 3-demethylubiquinone-9 3-methyltransferase (glyoxalase superfamily)